MNLPLHLFRSPSARSEQSKESSSAFARPEAREDKPMFRAPALPTLNQLHCDLPFTVRSRPRLRERF